MTSLRRRLLLWLLPATFLAGVLASAGTYWGSLDELNDLLNDQMRVIARQAQVDDDGKLSLAGRDGKKHVSKGDEADRVLLQVWRGQAIQFTTDPASPLPAPLHPGFADIIADGQTWHTFVSQSGDTLIRVAQARQARWEALAAIAVHLFWPVLSLLPLLALFLWFGIGYGLRPLRQIASGLARRNASNMERIDTAALPGEVKPLVEALNDLLLRLDRSFTMQKHFIADAAHELRTPIMGLSIQAQLLLRASSAAERESIQTQIQTGTTRLAHLAEQLLTLARLAPETEGASVSIVDLSALARSVVTDRARIAEANQIDLGLVSTETVTVEGSGDNLRILLNNLVDNAIRYAGPRASVDVVVRRNGETAVLEVSDNGPGIPEADRSRVWERFYRSSAHTASGSGLGLSIVKRIAEQHRATVSLDAGPDSKGLTVRLCFYLPPSQQ
ncbi:sensor histidine kinase [Paraburkholderia lacunae]|uniref:histidine kinase n=1 Tax=Paraburkholderia lacunae TaxID=2211104 RepID=A0A370ND81_9BURK|nr:ATP-binding protein [Paraburkholderia lacunae]RDK03552.1 two-component sensor histidine kinase [Paraburkholderia lacunae]